MKTTEARIVNRIPPSTTKRAGSCSSAERHRKRQKPNTTNHRPEEEDIPKLDPSNPVHAKRIQQRRKAISKGKNTAGYDAYIQQVPKDKRRLRSMDTPSTPNALLDMPKKRWDGIVRAWYVYL